MTLDDLVNAYNGAKGSEGDVEKGIRAVVEALRDEMVPPEYTHLTNTEKGWLQFFNEILASDGVDTRSISKTNCNKGFG